MFVCLSVCEQNNWISYASILMKFEEQAELVKFKKGRLSGTYSEYHVTTRTAD